MTPAEAVCAYKQITQPWVDPIIKIDQGGAASRALAYTEQGGRLLWISLCPMAKTLNKCRNDSWTSPPVWRGWEGRGARGWALVSDERVSWSPSAGIYSSLRDHQERASVNSSTRSPSRCVRNAHICERRSCVLGAWGGGGQLTVNGLTDTGPAALGLGSALEKDAKPKRKEKHWLETVQAVYIVALL